MEVYPLVNVNIANWKITIFNRSFNCKRTIFNSYVLKKEGSYHDMDKSDKPWACKYG